MIENPLGRLIFEGKFDATLDPHAVDSLGKLVADLLELKSIEAIVCWDGDDEAVFAQVVASRLNVRIFRAQENLGLLTLNASPCDTIRIALLATRWGGRRPLDSLMGLATNSGLVPVIAASLMAGEEESYQEVPLLVLEKK